LHGVGEGEKRSTKLVGAEKKVAFGESSWSTLHGITLAELFGQTLID